MHWMYSLVVIACCIVSVIFLFLQNSNLKSCCLVVEPNGLIVPIDSTSTNGERQLYSAFASAGESIDWKNDAQDSPGTFNPRTTYHFFFNDFSNLFKNFNFEIRSQRSWLPPDIWLVQCNPQCNTGAKPIVKYTAMLFLMN